MAAGRIIATGVVLALAAACGDGDTATTTAAGDARAGEAAYAANCAQCHGADLRGTDQGPPFLHEVYVPSHHADAAFRLAVERGVPAHHWDFGPMPAIGGLEPQEVEDIIAFVRERQRAAGVVD